MIQIFKNVIRYKSIWIKKDELSSKINRFRAIVLIFVSKPDIQLPILAIFNKAMFWNKIQITK